MYSFLAIVGFWLVGVPGLVYLLLQLQAADRRRTLAYEWNTSELERRQQRLLTLEAQAGAVRKKIGELMLEKARLDARAGKLQTILDERQAGEDTAAAT